jgi:glutathione S-transferase
MTTEAEKAVIKQRAALRGVVNAAADALHAATGRTDFHLHQQAAALGDDHAAVQAWHEARAALTKFERSGG